MKNHHIILKISVDKPKMNAIEHLKCSFELNVYSSEGAAVSLQGTETGP